MIEENWIKAIVSWASKEPDVASVYLFGSRIKGLARPDSDLDVAVVVVRGATENDTYTTWTFQHEEWKAELQKSISVKLDLQLGNPELSTTVVGPAIQSYGQLVYEKEQK
ncbi:nucleotidyltransferase domain-containing protein [Hyphomonas jannaschiana]|uniref:nucleotidyltransferase domain-containing protein n=1 Tax=Hyphomonas jannaschiana TaxID=86 RepID=UPI0035C72291